MSKPKFDPEDVWLSTREAAAHCGMSMAAIQQLVFRNRLPYKKHGRLLYFKLADLNDHKPKPGFRSDLHGGKGITK